MLNEQLNMQSDENGVDVWNWKKKKRMKSSQVESSILFDTMN